jgi:hypothetical protein
MEKNYFRSALLCTGAFLMLLGTSTAADKVVVVPLWRHGW